MAISTAELVELARGRGAAVTPRQIERWRYEGLLPRAERKGLGRGRGTAWVYTDDVVDRFCAIVELVVKQRLSLAEAAVRLRVDGVALGAAVFRKHLCVAAGRLGRVRTKLTGPNLKAGLTPAERAGESFLDGLRRRPEARTKWGMRRWDQAEQSRMAAFAGDLVSTVGGEKHELEPETVNSAKFMLRISPEDDVKLRAGGVDMDRELRTGPPTFATIDRLAEGATDEELATAASLCGMFANEAICAQLSTATGLPHAFAAQLREIVGLGGSTGVLSCVSAIRRFRAAALPAGSLP